MKLTAIPFRDAFPKYRWAQLEIFDGYLAVIPFEGRVDRREYNLIRRANLKRVLRLAIEELGTAAANGTPSAALARLRRIRVAKVKLPRRIRVRCHEETRLYRSQGDGTTAVSEIRRGDPAERLVRIQDLVDYGLHRACALQMLEAFEPEGHVREEGHAD